MIRTGFHPLGVTRVMTADELKRDSDRRIIRDFFASIFSIVGGAVVGPPVTHPADCDCPMCGFEGHPAVAYGPKDMCPVCWKTEHRCTCHGGEA